MKSIRWQLTADDAVTILDALDHAVSYWQDRLDEAVDTQERDYARLRISSAHMLASSAHHTFGL